VQEKPSLQLGLWVRHMHELRKKILRYYGEECACCGERIPEFLCIDHVNNDGKEERKTITGHQLYRYIIKNRFPPGRYQLLCYNCNNGKALYGQCPHKTGWIPIKTRIHSRERQIENIVSDGVLKAEILKAYDHGYYIGKRDASLQQEGRKSASKQGNMEQIPMGK
jgi:hypothetical protein